MRYETECYILGEYALNALNKPKNVNKPQFEDMELKDIIKGLHDEITEMMLEINPDYLRSNILKQNHKINFDRTIDELADVAAYLVGLFVKLSQIKDEIKDEK